VVATFETSLYDEWGVRRKDFGLASLFGASFAGKVQGPILNSYLQLERSGEGAAEILAGFGEVPRIVNAGNQVETKPLDTAYRAAVGVIPSYPDLPMEEVFLTSQATSGPGVYLKSAGAGRVAYMPGDIDRTFWETLDEDQGRLIVNAVRWATNEPAVVEVKGIGVVDLAVWRQERSITVHMVNLTNPMMMKGPVRELIPIPSQQVKLRLPDGDRVRRVRLLSSGKEVAHQVANGVISVQTDTIKLHEIVAVDLV